MAPTSRLDDPGRLESFQGRILDWAPDPELDSIVQAAAIEFGFPTAVIGLVLRRTQFLRAHVGLPPELAALRAVDRGAFCCQLVVDSNRPVEIRDAMIESDPPHEFVPRYGLRAFVGCPLRVRGQVVGALGLADTAPRSLEPRQREAFAALAEAASRRLGELAAEAELPRGALGRAQGAAFAEMRNLLSVIVAGSHCTRMASVELAEALDATASVLLDAGASAPAALAAAASFPESQRAHGDIASALADIDDAVAKLTMTVTDLEATVAPHPAREPSLGEVLEAASISAHRAVMAKGGVRVATLERAARARSAPRFLALATNLVLHAIAERLGPSAAGVDVVVEASTSEVRLTFRARDLDGEAWLDIAMALRFLLADLPTIRLEATASALALRVPAEG